MRNGKRNGYAWFRMLCITASIMLLLLCATASFAEGTVVFEGDETVTRVSGETGGLSNNQAAAGYINRLMKGGKTGSTGLVGRGTLAGAQLTGKEKTLYDKLKDQILSAARGDISSTVFEVPVRDLYENVTYTAAQLGVSSITSETREEAMTRFYALLTHPDTDKVLNALLADLPYDLYWYDKLTGCEYGYPSYSYNVNEMSIGNYDSGVIRYSFTVAGAYRDQNVSGNEYLIDQGFGQNAVQAAENAESIISEYAALGDYAKLNAYKDWICEHTSYNDDAADDENETPYGNPWQMVWVFDDNSSTNVVCEGYSKAFQYLCDQSDFSGNVTSILVTGVMSGGTGAGRHMWNLVQTEADGPWYLVDVTNSDEGSAGEAGGLFMDGYDSQDNDRYLYNTAGGGQVAYSFDEEIAGLYGDGYPVLSESAYTPAYSPELRVPERIAEDENLQINIFNATDVGFIRADLTDPNNPQSSVSSVQGVEFAAYKRFSERPEPCTEVEGVSFSGDQLDAYIANTRSEGLIFLQVQLYGWPEEGQDLGEQLLSQVFIVVRGSGEVSDAPVMLINGQDEDLTVEPYSTVYFGAVLPEGTTGVRILTNQNWAAFEKATQGRHVSLSHNELSPGDSFTCYAQITKDEIPENTSDWTSVVNWKAISEPVKVTAGAGQPAPAPEFTWNAEEGTIAENEILEIEITNIPETDGRKHYYAQFQKALGQGDEEWDIWQTVEWDEDTEKIWIWTSRSLAGAFMNPSLENAGRYQIRICAENEGYVKSFSEWRELTVSKADPADSGWLCLQADSILCGDEVRVMAYDPQASQIRVEILENSEGPDDPVIHNWSMDGNLHNWKYQLLRSGSYTVRAFSGQYTGDELEEELIGEKELEVVASGTLDKVGISGVKDAYRTGEYAVIAFSTVDHADGYEYTVKVERDDGSTETIVHTGEPAMLRSGTIRFRISDAGKYTVEARAYARGYEETIARKTFVALEQDPEDTFTLTVNGQTGETSLVTHAPAEVRILAPGAKAVRVLTGHGEWTYIDGSRLDAATGEYAFDHAWATGEYTAVAQAFYGEIEEGKGPQDWWGEDNWQYAWSGWSQTENVKTSNLVELTVTAPHGPVSTPVMEILNGASLMRGDFLRVRVTADENAAETTVTVNDGENVLAEISMAEKDIAIFDTINLTPGEYTVKAVSTGKEGYEDSETASAAVTVTEAQAGEIWIEKTEAFVGENIRIMAYQPGGSLLIEGSGEKTDGYYAVESDGYLIQPLCLEEGEHEITLTLKDGTEAPVKTVTETLKWNYAGTLATPTIHAPETVETGKGFSFTVDNLDRELDSWLVELYSKNGRWLNSWSSDDDPQKDFRVSAEELEDGDLFRLRSSVDRRGYRSAEYEVMIRVSIARDPNLTLYLNKSNIAEVSAQAQEKLYLKAVATGNNMPSMIRIFVPQHGDWQYYEGEDLEYRDGKCTAYVGEAAFESGTYLLYAQSYYGEVPKDRSEWDSVQWAGESNAITLHVTKAGDAVPGTVTLTGQRVFVEQGEPLWVNVGAGQHVSEYNVNIMVQNPDGSYGNASGAMSSRRLWEPGPVWMATADLNPGTYYVQVYCRGEQNYDSASSDRYIFGVKPRTGQDQFLFSASMTEGVSQDDCWLSMYYPGADYYIVYSQHEGQEEPREDWTTWLGETGTGEKCLTFESSLQKAWAEAWKNGADGAEDTKLATSSDISFTVAETQSYNISIQDNLTADAAQDQLITVNGLADADMFWEVELSVFDMQSEEWQSILNWTAWKGDKPSDLVIPTGTLTDGELYRINANCTRYGSDTAFASMEIGDAELPAPGITAASKRVLIDDYAQFSAADPDIEQVRYEYSMEGDTVGSGSYDIGYWDLNRTGTATEWKIQIMGDAGERTFTFSVMKDGVWSEWTEPIIITGYFAGNLNAPTVTAPHTLRAGEPLSIRIGAVDHADTYSINLINQEGYPETIQRNTAGEVLLKGFGLNAGEYRILVETVGKHYRGSISAIHTLTVTGDRPAAPVPETESISGAFGEWKIITAGAADGSLVTACRAWDKEPGDLYMPGHGTVRVPVKLEYGNNPVYLRALAGGCWSALSAGVPTTVDYGEPGDDREITVTAADPSVLRGEDVQITFTKTEEAEIYTYNVCYLDKTLDEEDPMPVNVVYETPFEPQFDGNTGSLTVPAYYFRYVGDYRVTVNAYRGDIWRSYLGEGSADVEVAENTNTVSAPTAVMRASTYPLYGTVTAQVQTGGAERLVAYVINSYNSTGQDSFVAETIELEAGQENYTFHWFADAPGEYSLAFAVYRNGVLSPDSDELRFTVKPADGRLISPVLSVPESVNTGEAFTVTWPRVEGAGWYTLEIDDAKEEAVYRSGRIDGGTTSLTVPAGAINGSGQMTVWMEACAEGKEKAWSKEKYLTVADPVLKPTGIFKSGTPDKMTILVSGISGDRLAVAVNGTEAGYVTVTADSGTAEITVPIGSGTDYIQVANRGTDGFGWSVFSDRIYPHYANTLTLPAGLTEIESEAFANLGSPVNIIIPAGVSGIADDAFTGSTVLLIVQQGSNAETWARENGYSYMLQQ